MFAGMSVAAVIPARDEAGAIESVVRDLLEVSDGDGHRIIERVIVVDNASKDDTAERAAAAGAIVVGEPDGAYGAACLRGIAAIDAAEVVLFVDGDASCCATQVPELLRAIVDGADLAIGARIEALRERGAMTFPQRCARPYGVSGGWRMANGKEAAPNSHCLGVVDSAMWKTSMRVCD